MSESVLKKKSTLNISLVLIGTLAVGCGEDGQRQIYKTKADCAAEWSDKDCEEIPSTSSHYHTGRYMGPFHSYSHSSGRSTRSVGSSHVTRGGFGRSSSFHSSGG
ncbi:MAG TPA: hypothetical protein PL048_00910 [Leptospiraceae bacterium]|nr:hypothetical protein [Leptospiraceae bacterium]HMZ57303.1 hypothetical protein [Leptospiraceae bacterium]HNF13769.1 hypothetical protein [Leptospiraceae bacterium]HNF25991.1 hypothetical protein [Leptospiraceae bacterium]HNO21476.1 hypothetical protein [Leptospiraceae bacterium]